MTLPFKVARFPDEFRSASGPGDFIVLCQCRSGYRPGDSFWGSSTLRARLSKPCIQFGTSKHPCAPNLLAYLTPRRQSMNCLASDA